MYGLLSNKVELLPVLWKFCVVLFLVLVTSCASTYDTETGLYLGGIKAVTANQSDLSSVSPDGKLSNECELEQRTYLFVSNIPAVDAYVKFNSYWMNYFYNRNPNLAPAAKKDISPCIKDPYKSSDKDSRNPATLKESEGK